MNWASLTPATDGAPEREERLGVIRPAAPDQERAARADDPKPIDAERIGDQQVAKQRLGLVPATQPDRGADRVALDEAAVAAHGPDRPGPGDALRWRPRSDSALSPAISRHELRLAYERPTSS